MDGDNPEMNRPIDREAFHLCKLLWGNQQQQQAIIPVWYIICSDNLSTSFIILRKNFTEAFGYF